MTANAKLRTLRDKTDRAAMIAKRALETIGLFEYEAQSLMSVLRHDNVRVIEADSEPFEFKLAGDKQQVVVVLKGRWVMTHGSATRELEVADVIKVPIGSPFATVLSTKEKGSKFVYVQFR